MPAESYIWSHFFHNVFTLVYTALLDDVLLYQSPTSTIILTVVAG